MSDAAETRGEVVLHALEGRGLQPPVVARMSGDVRLLHDAAAGLPEGAALPEAVAARVRRAGGALAWGEPEEADTRTLLRFCRARGASSVEMLRADPSLLPDLRIGAFFEARIRMRVLRRVLCRPLLDTIGARLVGPLSVTVASDIAFWSGVRAAATPVEWQRLTRSSYVVLYYHRIAGEGKPGQERLDVAPEVFERHMRLLRRLRFRPLTAEELTRFHADPEATLGPRRVIITADDGFRDAVVALGRHADLRPFLFVTTSAVGRIASWADGETTASWSELREIASRGAEIASHARTHVPLPELGADALAAELRESLDELRTEIPQAAPFLAYPHGRNDATVRAAAAASGYRAAFTTDTGRNGSGTDQYRLRRVGPKNWDGAAAFIWKALTGQLVPWPLERCRLWLYARRPDRPA